jgi:hypothetical protein
MYVDVYLSSQIHEGIHAEEKDIYTCPMHPKIISENPGECPECGMFLVKKEKTSELILAVPESAVIDTGVRKIVYVEKEKGIYFPRKVNIGVNSEAVINGQKRKFYAVISGLSEGMKVVTQANFLLDSQSQITGQLEATYSGAIEKDKKNKTSPLKHIH